MTDLPEPDTTTANEKYPEPGPEPEVSDSDTTPTPASTPVAHATPCGPNVCGVVTHEGAAPAPEPGLRDRMAGRRGDYAAALAQSFAGPEGGRLERMTDAVTAVADGEQQQLLALLGEAVDWIHDGELRDRICAALNPQDPS